VEETLWLLEVPLPLEHVCDIPQIASAAFPLASAKPQVPGPGSGTGRDGLNRQSSCKLARGSQEPIKPVRRVFKGWFNAPRRSPAKVSGDRSIRLGFLEEVTRSDRASTAGRNLSSSNFEDGDQSSSGSVGGVLSSRKYFASLGAGMV
jgi:hypothetical protein